MKLERAGFYPALRRVDVPAQSHTTVHVTLLPTPETRDSYLSTQRARRLWGFVGVASGAALALGGGAFLLWNRAQKDDKQQAFDQLLAESQPGSGLRCDPRQDVNAELCAADRDAALNALDAARGRDVLGWASVGVGAAALGVRAMLLLSSHPGRYDFEPESDVFGGVPRLRVGMGLGTAFLGLETRL